MRHDPEIIKNKKKKKKKRSTLLSMKSFLLINVKMPFNIFEPDLSWKYSFLGLCQPEKC